MDGSNPNDRLQQLEADVLALGNIVESLLMAATDMLHENDLDALEKLGEQGRLVHSKRLAIEMGCLTFIASQRPQHAKLRPLVAMVEIAAELERMAEHGQEIARANYLTADHQLRRPLASIHRLACEVEGLLDAALSAFIERDGAAARAVAGKTQEVETLYQQVRLELLEVVTTKPRIANQAIFVSRSAYSLRRAAAHIAGVCEWVVFAVDGSLGPPLTDVTPHQSEQVPLSA
jgi:phosphate transport system protein